MRVKSFISTPRDKSILKGGAICLSGFAWSGRSDIDQVELSADGGDSWESADLLGPSTRYSWQQWNYRWNTSKRGHYTIISRARDTQGNVQPMRSVWNEMGYEVNGTMSLCLDVLWIYCHSVIKVPKNIFDQKCFGFFFRRKNVR